MIFARFVASGFGVGFAPKAPGTAGSLLGLALAVPLMAGPPWLLPLGCLGVCLVGTWATVQAGGADDPGWVVIDEVAGQWIALLALSGLGWLGFALAFALFRLFDIAKPGPIGWVDRQGGALSVMADDVLAGLAAAACLGLLRLSAPSLGL